MTEQADQAPIPGSPEYDAAMAAKFREAQGTVSQDTIDNYEGKQPGEPEVEPKVRPDNVPEKFWDAENGVVRTDELLKSYTALESSRSKPDTVDPKDKPEDDTAAQEAAKAAGLDWDSLGSKINSAGDIDEADYAALEKIGIPKDLAQEYVELRKDRQERETAAAYDHVGGKEAAEALLSWASQNLTKEEVGGYNEMLAGPNWKVALDTLKTRRDQASATASEPHLLVTKTVPGGSTVGYQTEDEMRVDMRNPLYRENTPKGEAFRREVQEKVRLAAYRRNR